MKGDTETSGTPSVGLSGEHANKSPRLVAREEHKRTLSGDGEEANPGNSMPSDLCEDVRNSPARWRSQQSAEG